MSTPNIFVSITNIPSTAQYNLNTQNNNDSALKSIGVKQTLQEIPKINDSTLSIAATAEKIPEDYYFNSLDINKVLNINGQLNANNANIFYGPITASTSLFVSGFATFNSAVFTQNVCTDIINANSANNTINIVADSINIGTTNSQIIIYGSSTTISETILHVEDKLINVNLSVGNLAADNGHSSGILIRGTSGNGWIQTTTNASRFLIKPPLETEGYIVTTDLANNLIISGNSLLNNAEIMNDLTVTNNSKIYGYLTVGTNLTVSGSSLIKGALTSNSLFISNNSILRGNILISGTTVLKGNVTTGNLIVTGQLSTTNLSVLGNFDVPNNIIVSGDSLLKGNVTANNLVVTGQLSTTNLSVLGNFGVPNNITVSGDSLLKGNVIANNLVVTGQLSTTNLSVLGNFVVPNNITVSGDSLLKGNVTAGNLIVTGQLSTTNLSVLGNFGVPGDLNITGNSLLGGNVLIGTSTTRNSNVLLELNTTTQGFLPPRMPSTNRQSITSPAGLVVYQSDTNLSSDEGLYCLNGSGKWKNITHTPISLFAKNATTGLIQSGVTSNSVTTIINWTSAAINTPYITNTSIWNSTNGTFKAPYAMTVRASASLVFNSHNQVNNQYWIGFEVPGTIIERAYAFGNSSTTAPLAINGLNTICNLQSAQELKLVAYQSAGSTLNYNSFGCTLVIEEINLLV